MKAKRNQIIKEVENVLNQVTALSVRIDDYKITDISEHVVEVATINCWGTIIEVRRGTPMQMLMFAKCLYYNTIS